MSMADAACGQRRPVAGGCGLLVSVRDEAEAVEALHGGADVIDVKEPAFGPLGAAACEVAACIGAAVGRHRPWTLACGELEHGAAPVHAAVRRTVALLGDGVPWPAAAKAGLAGTVARDWHGLLAAFAAGLPAGIAAVAVAYADWTAAGSPRPEEVIETARARGFRFLLIDTFDKAGAPVVGAGGAGPMTASWIVRARQAGMRVVLAGGLATATVPGAVALGPDLIAVRSAACPQGRLGRVCRHAVRRLGKLCGPAASAAPVFGAGS